MGFGLRLKPTGNHIVFAAGTGVLCFVDLVAYLARLSFGMHLGESYVGRSQAGIANSTRSYISSVMTSPLSRSKVDYSDRDTVPRASMYTDVPGRKSTYVDPRTEVDLDNFRLHFYVSFPRRSVALALDLLEGFEAFCRRTNNNCFHLHLRISEEGAMTSQRWDENFIRQEISKYGAKNIQRVWVCGPPAMNEFFDRVFSAEETAAPSAECQTDEAEVDSANLLSLGLTRDQYEIL